MVRSLALVLSFSVFLWGILEAPALLQVPEWFGSPGMTTPPSIPDQPVAVPGGQPPAGAPEALGSQKIAPAASPASDSPPKFRRLPVPATLSQIMQMELAIQKYARAFGVDEDLVWAVVRRESGFNPAAISPKGAMGLMQLMPGTADMLGVSDPFDVEQNIAGGIKYLERCLSRFNGDVGLALAAYNAGPENVDKYQGCPPFSETLQYVASVLQDYSGPPRIRVFDLRPPGPPAPSEIAAAPRGSGLCWNLPTPMVKTAKPKWHVPPPRWKLTGREKLQTLATRSSASSPSLRSDWNTIR